MPYYVVKEGEQLAQIVARECGPTTDVQTVVSDAKNEPLFKSRSPNVLGTGDKVWLPDDKAISPLQLKLSTGSFHRVVIKRTTRSFRLKLAQPDRTPIANAPFVLTVGGQPYRGTTDGDGMLEVQLPLDAYEGEISVGDRKRSIQVGGLEPLHLLRGVQGRLLNLGYSPGPIDGVMGYRTVAAIKAFQADHGLKVDGVVGDETRARLKSAYGF
jgi:hypothetical protein